MTLTDRQKSILRVTIDYSGAFVSLVAYLVTRNFQTATWCLVGVSTIAILAGFLIERRVAPLPLIYGGFAVVFGGLTLIFHDARFVKMKTTFVDLALGASMLTGFFMGKSPIKMLIGEGLKMSDAGWRRLTLRFGLFFIATALLNEAVWRTQPDAVWFFFRWPGLLILSFFFAFTQVPMMIKDAKALEAASRIIETQGS